MSPDIRTAICHWHLQLTDPMYRAFTGEFLIARHDTLHATVRLTAVLNWVAEQGPGRWTIATRKQLASKLLSCALSAGLVAGRRDPRTLCFPRIPDLALGYLLHLLRGIDFEGNLSANPYLRSVGLEGPVLEDRLRKLPYLNYRRMGDLFDFEFQHADLRAWAADALRSEGALS